MSLNKVMLIGNVGKDPEIRHLGNDSMVANFPLATSERFKDKNGEWQDQTEWHNIVCWRVLAERVEKYVKKGAQLYIEGRIRTNSWVDQSGQKKYTTEIVADNMQMLDSKGGTGGAPSSTSNASASSQPMETAPALDSFDDDVPF